MSEKNDARAWHGREVGEADRGLWLAARRCAVGASEVAALFGCSPYATPMSVYLAKVGAYAEEREAAPHLQIGLALEPALERLYAERTGRSVARRQVFYLHADAPLSCTVDAVDDAGGLAEFKTRGSRDGLGEPGTEDIPPHWYYQAQAQMACTGADRVTFGVLYADRRLVFDLFPVERDGAAIGAILSTVRRFWGEHVGPGVPPPPERPEDVSWIPRLRKGAPRVALAPERSALAEEYLRAREAQQEAKRRLDDLKVALACSLKGGTEGVCPDGTTVRLAPSGRGYTIRVTAGPGRPAVL